MVKNEVNNKRRVQELRAGGAEDLKELYTHYRDTSYGSGVPLLRGSGRPQN